MKKEDIITLPHEDLRKRSVRVGFIDDKIIQLIDDMRSATLDWEMNREHEVGVALAAVQIDKLYRVVIVRDNFNDRRSKNFSVFINPEITKYDGDIVEEFEGCLSIKDIYGKVPRYSKVKVKALNLDGKEFRVTAEGFLARIFQHEIDHTNGMLFVDRIKDSPDAFYKLGKTGKIEELGDNEREEIFRILW